MSTHRAFLVLALLLALLANVPTAAGQQPDRNIALATGCDLDAFERARAEFERLQTVKQFRPDQVSAGELTAAANAYVALGERCYQALYANATEKIDDGGLFFEPGGAVSGQFRTLGLKWGAGSPYVGGQDIPSPGIAGGTVTYSFMPNGVSNADDLPLPADPNLAIASLPGFQACFVTDIRNAFAAWTAIANIQFTEVADNGVAFNAHGATGDIRIGSHTFDGVSGTLAHGYYPPPNGTSAAGDVHFDRAENWSCSPGAGLIDIGLVALHEVGHALGLDHETTDGRVAIMGKFYNAKLMGLLPDDINGARAIYGPEVVVPSPPFPPSPPSPPPPPRKDDILSDFGAAGLWQLFDGNITTAWVQADPLSPKSIATGDLDGNGMDEVIADFASGIRVKLNNGPWFPLHPATANRMATGDLDGNGKAEVVIDFPGSGLWVWNNNSFWSQLHPASPTNFVIGDMDGGGKMEAIADFAGSGIWVWWNGAFWQQLHAVNSTSMVVGDFDGNDKADVVVNFPGAGIWNYANNADWSHIHEFNPQHMTAGDIDGDFKSDFVGDFGPGIGVWMITSSTGFSWSRISTMVSSQLVVGDLNGNGKADVIANFGANGLWLYADNIALIQIHAASPEALAVGDFNGP